MPTAGGVPIVGPCTQHSCLQLPAHEVPARTRASTPSASECSANNGSTTGAGIRPRRRAASLNRRRQDEPTLRGVTDVFGDSDVYEAYPPADAKILLRGQVVRGMKPTDPPADYRKRRSTDRQEQGINDPMMAVAWTRLHTNDAGKTNRVFCTTMGAATDLQNEGLRRLVINAVYWGLGMDIPTKAEVDCVGEYKPTTYGFKGYRRGVKPADLALGGPPE